jgi:hypothetical protein
MAEYQQKHRNELKTASLLACQSKNFVTPDVTPPEKQIVTPQVVTPDCNTPKSYHKLADLPEHTQAEIIRINAWCKQQGIADNLEQRIGIALDYARTHPESNTGRQGDYFIDNAGLKHKWSDVVAYAQHNIPMPEGITVNA